MSARDDLEHAALAGDCVAASELAHLLDVGEGVVRDAEKAVEWYRVAADLGSKGAAYILACKYRDGSGVAKDDAMALMWFERSAALGDAAAHVLLAMTYRDGLLGQMPDVDRARLHSKLADECTAHEVAARQSMRQRLREHDANDLGPADSKDTK